MPHRAFTALKDQAVLPASNARQGCTAGEETLFQRNALQARIVRVVRPNLPTVKQPLDITVRQGRAVEQNQSLVPQARTAKAVVLLHSHARRSLEITAQKARLMHSASHVLSGATVKAVTT